MIRCLPPDTARDDSSTAGARLIAASATTTPRAIAATSSTPSAGPRAAGSDDRLMGSHEPERVLERAAPLAREVHGGGQPFAGRARDRERRVALAAQAQACIRRVVLDEDAAVAH